MSGKNRYFCEVSQQVLSEVVAIDFVLSLMFSVIFLLRCVSNSNLSSHKSFDLEQKIEFAVFSIIHRQQNIDKLAGDVMLMLPALWSSSNTDMLNC